MKISKKNKYNKKVKNKKRNIELIINKRYQILIFFIICLFTIILLRLFIVQIIDKEKYATYVYNYTNNFVDGETAPRGRIYDRNMNLLVDNKVVKEITYTYKSGIKTKDEINMAYFLVDLIDLSYKSQIIFEPFMLEEVY